MVSVMAIFVSLAAFQAVAATFSPYEPAQAVEFHEGYLFQRQNQCLSSQKFCPGANGSSGCCSTDSQCAADDAGRLACCPSGAVCTGRLGGGGTQPTTQAPGSSPATTQATPTDDPNAGGSTVPNPYYPYVYLPKTYQNADLCSSAFSSCRTEFSKCTSTLTVGGNGVTVSGAQGGITAQPALNPASAGSICSSLSTLACYNLGLGNCPEYGTAVVTGGTFSAGNAAPSGCAQKYRVAVAVAIGVAGQAIR
ncbi:MAG: hypothetical protein Q9166_000393 [cf. Caloplaca sp. 2 TL-2023]